MIRIFKRKVFYPIIGALAFVFALVMFFVNSPNAYADTSTIESLTLANINSGNVQGQYGNFSWDNSKLKSVSDSKITTDRNKDPFCIVWTRPSNGSYASALSFSVNVVDDSVGAITIRYDDDTVPSYIQPGEKQSGILTNNVNSLSSKYEKIYFYISCSYMSNDVILSSVSIQIKATTYPISFSKGTGLKAAFLSTNNSATSGSASGTQFAKWDTVYCFAKLDKGYKAQSGWTLISGTANSEDAIYRVGTRSNISASYSFGTLSAIAKTASIYRYGNGGSNLGNVSLTYGSSAELGTPTRTGYEFIGWNTAQNGTGNTISSSLTAEEVNAIIDAGTPTSVYAQWSINAAGVVGLIENIGQVSYTSDSKSRIDTAREAYNSLDSEEQALVTNYETLTTAEATYAKLKADNEAADAVDALIEAIGTVEYTTTSKGKIDAAREAYDALTADQKALVDNYSTLTAAETEYAKLKADNEAADAVDALINAIGTVEYTTASKAKIDDARKAYDALTADQKALVDNYAKLTAAEATYKNLDDNAKANAVDALISAIGKVEYTTASKAKIDDARKAYDALTADQKALVENYSTLTAAETEYNNQKVTGANNVKNMIDAIPYEVDYDDEECVNKIFDAREAYDALTEEQQALVENYAKLTAAEATYKNLDDNAKANAVDALISAIGKVEYTTTCKTKIDAAREAYDALTADQKELVTNYQKLLNAEAAYNVMVKINAIGTVEYTAASKAKIEDARKAYDALTAEQKVLVSNYKTLTDAEEKYAELELDATRHSLEDKDNGVKVETKDGKGIPKTITLKVEVKTTVSATEGSKAHDNITSNIKGNEKISGVYDVKLIQTINGVEKEIQPSNIKEGTKIKIHIAIPEGVIAAETRILHIHSEDDMEYVENVEVVDNEFVFEVSKLSEFALVTLTHGMSGWAIALIVIGSFIAVMVIIYCLFFFVFNKWIIINGKAIRVFAYGKKDDKIRVVTMYLTIEYKAEGEVFNTKEEISALIQQ